jgi:hypothetical protein
MLAATTLVQAYYISGATLAVLGVLTLVYKGISAFETTKRRVADISREFQPNGGHSMRDKVDAIVSEQQRVALALLAADGQRQVDAQRLADHILADSAAFNQQASTNQRIEGTLQRLDDHLRKAQP